jgi:hypothetical protein
MGKTPGLLHISVWINYESLRTTPNNVSKQEDNISKFIHYIMLISLLFREREKTHLFALVEVGFSVSSLSVYER